MKDEALEALILKTGMNPVMQGSCYVMHPEALQAVIDGAIKQALAAPAQEPSGLRHIGEQDCLIDVDEKAWQSIVENRGGCRCHIAPPCGACSNPISEEEMNEVGYTYNTQSAQPAPVQGQVLGFEVVLDESLPPNTMKFVQPAPVQDLPFGVGGGLVAIKTLLSRDPCVHANTAIEMIDAILKEHSAAQPVAWVGLTDEDIEQEFGFIDELLRDCVHRTEAKLKEKNNG
jgi:hypothetical protein